MGRYILAFFALICFISQAEPSKIVMIIDDVGYRKTDEQAFFLPKEVAFSLLPFAPHTQNFSTWATEQRRDVMLHMPMQASLSQQGLGPGALMLDMYPEKIASTVADALNNVPNAIGVNNHMGSAFTKNTNAMDAFMDAVKQSQLFFVDSRTTPSSVAQQIATKKDIPNARRHVFIDNILNEKTMQIQLNSLIALSKKKGVAIGIAHPHPTTIRFLLAQLPNLNEQGVELMSVSEFFHHDQEKNMVATHQLLSK